MTARRFCTHPGCRRPTAQPLLALAAATASLAGAGADTAIDYVARFGVAVPILSFTAAWSEDGGAGGGADGADAGEGGGAAVELTCVQTTAIQQYSLDPARCSPPELSAEEAEAEQRDLARRSSLLERPPRRQLDIPTPDAATAVPMPSEGLASGRTTPREAPAQEEEEEEGGAAAPAAAAEPSIVGAVPALASIPPPPQPEPPAKVGGHCLVAGLGCCAHSQGLGEPAALRTRCPAQPSSTCCAPTPRRARLER